MKRLFLIVFVLLILGVSGAYMAYVYPIDLGERVVSLTIRSGDTFGQVADTLVERGVVRSRLLLSLIARWMRLDRSLTPGRYDFTGKNSVATVLAKLAKADFVRVKVTIYEGAPIWTVAGLLAQKLPIDSAAFLRLNEDSAFLARLELPYLEGRLFPETYYIPWHTPPELIAEEMVAMFHRQTDSLWDRPAPLELTPEQVLILASIVEAEAYIPEEKPLIASVYLNRLRRGMKLQADPTVIYGLGGVDRPLTRRDLRTDTPYNTYTRHGLPPTPINSPGIEAIRAVLYPAESDYLYFVADGTGKHVFSRTNTEHNRARRRIREAAGRR